MDVVAISSGAMKWWHKVRDVFTNVRVMVIWLDELASAAERASARCDGIGVASKQEGKGGGGTGV